MRRWLTASSAAARLVSEHPQLWVVGGLAWAATAGPVALFAAVVPAPNVSDLTFLAAGAFVSAAWPWNLAALALLALILVAVALALVAIADVALVRQDDEAGVRTLIRAVAVTLVASSPAVLLAAAVVAALAVVAPGEFSSPDAGGGGPLLRTILPLAPLLLALAVAVPVAGAWGAASRIAAVVDERPIAATLLAGLRLLRTAGTSGIVQMLVGAVARLAYLAVGLLLLAVLWAPIGDQLSTGAGFGPAEAALLVGFVAIWLCLVLGGGAVHAWLTVVWSRVLAVPTVWRGGPARSKETPSAP